MSRKIFDTELREAARATDALSIKVIDIMKMLVKIKARVERNDIDQLFFELYLSEVPQTVAKVMDKMEVDNKTLRRRRMLFCNVFQETKALLQEFQEESLKHIFTL